MTSLDDLMHRTRAGDQQARHELDTQLYGQLRAMAANFMASERRDHTLEPTALVHEAWLRLARDGMSEAHRTTYLAAAARTFSRVLIDYARAKRSLKRGGGFVRIEFTELSGPTQPESLVGESIAVEEMGLALEAFEAEHPKRCEAVQMHICGMSSAEIATYLEVDERTVRNYVTFAMAWLRRRCHAADGHASKSA